MTTYAWPDFLRYQVDRFEMRVQPNTRVFVSPFTGGAQVADYTGERWMVSLDIVPGIDGSGADGIVAAAIEAYFDRLRGPLNRIALWNLRRPVPLGTLRDGVVINVVNGSLAAVTVQNGAAVTIPTISGSPINMAAVAQGSSTVQIQTVAGRTLLAGDHIGLPNGQNVRVMADAVADGAGVITPEINPRARSDIAAYAGPVVWNKPTANFMLKSDGVPITHRPGMYESTSLDLVEAI
jgi:hypothetical protein